MQSPRIAKSATVQPRSASVNGLYTLLVCWARATTLIERTRGRTGFRRAASAAALQVEDFIIIKYLFVIIVFIIYYLLLLYSVCVYIYIYIHIEGDI